MPLLPDAPTRFADLTSRERRWAVSKGIMFNVGVWVTLTILYFIIPARSASGGGAALRVVIGVVVFAVVVSWQGWRISHGPIPELRAVEALGTILPVFLLIFATLYLTSSSSHPHAFTQPLNHVAAIYFAITVFSTVGFGDITPVSDGMRIAVSIQMLLDLVFLGTVVRVIFSRARSALGRQDVAG